MGIIAGAASHSPSLPQSPLIQSVPASTLARLPAHCPTTKRELKTSLSCQALGPAGVPPLPRAPTSRGVRGPVLPRPLQTSRNRAVLVPHGGQVMPVTSFGASCLAGPNQWCPMRAGLSAVSEAALNAHGVILCVLHQCCPPGPSRLRLQPAIQPTRHPVRDWAGGPPP